MPSNESSVQRDGEALVFTGALTRGAVAALWKATSMALDGIRQFNVTAVDEVDSAGLALLAELAEGAGGIETSGDPAGLAELRSAYRLSHTLGYAG
jgi:phospholipid transport system transporter-binding protein